MIRKLIVAIFLIFAAQTVFAQASQDDFLGRSDIGCPAPVHRVAASVSQDNGTPGNAGTVQHVTITNATIVQDSTYSQDYDVTISSPSMSFIIGINEPFKILGTGTTMDWSYDGTTQLNGGSFITAVNTSTGVITMTADHSVSHASATGQIEPGRYYDPFSQTQQIGGTVSSPQFTVSTPFGDTEPICDPEEHWVYVEALSQMCVQTATGLCTYSQTLASESVSGGVVTANSSIALPTWIVGSSVTVAGVSDTSYNGTFSLVSVNNATGTLTWNDATTNATAVGGNIKFGSNFYPLVSESQSGGVVTAIFTVWTHLGLGAPITVNGVTGTGFNGNFNVTSIFGQSFTYSDASASGSGTGGSMTLNGYATWPARFSANGSISATCNAAIQYQSQWTQGLGANATGEDSTGEVLPSSGVCPNNPATIPALNNFGGTVVSPTIYAEVNLGGWAPQPLHDITNGITHTFNAVFNNPIGALDYQDSQYFPFALKYFGVGGGTTGAGTGLAGYKSMSSIGVMVDDTDQLRLTSGFGLMRGQNNSVNAQGSGQFENIGLMMAMTDPHQTITNAAFYTGGVNMPMIYPNDVITGKSLSAVAPSSCSLTSPCSWPDYERNKYATIGALNAAYGSNYTTFDSTETKVTGLVVGTGDGTTTTFSCTLGTGATCGTGTAGRIVPGSIHFYLKPSGGTATMVSGDCAFYSGLNHAGCPNVTGGGTFLTPPAFKANLRIWQNWAFTDSSNCIEVANTAGSVGSSFTPPASCTGTQQTTSGSVTFTAIGPKIAAASTIIYATGVLTANFTVAPPTGYQILVDYTYCGFATTCGTGLRDEDGTGVGGQWGTGTVNTSGTSVTLASGTNFSTGTVWNGLPIKIGATTFHIASVNSATSLTLTSSAGTLTGSAFTVNGLGTNDVCVINPQPWQANHAYTAYTIDGIIQDANDTSWLLAIQSGTSGTTPPTTGTSVGTIQTDNTGVPPLKWLSLGGPVCNPGNGAWLAVIDAQQQFARDVSDWLGEYAASYFSANHTMARLLAPDAIDLGTNFSLQSYDIPTYPSVLQANELYSDAAFAGDFPPVSSDARGIGINFDPISQYKYNFVTTYYNKNIIAENFMETSSGFDIMSLSNFQPNGIVARANAYYDRVFTFLHTKSVNGIMQNSGETWWGNMPFQGHPFGFLDLSGNLTDGHENVTGVVSCSAPLGVFSCGNEVAGNPWNGIDTVNCTQCMKAANQIWLVNAIQPTAKTKKSIFADVNLIPKIQQGNRLNPR